MSRGSQIAGLFALSPLIVAVLVGFLLEVVAFGLIFDLPLVVLVLIYAFWITPNYFFEIVEHRAMGREAWPVLSIETLVAQRSQVGIVFSLLVLTVAGIGVALRYFGQSGWASVLLGLGLALLPPAVALLAVTREFGAALNPARMLAAAAGMGQGYLYCLLGAGAIIAVICLAPAQGGFIWYFPLAYGLFLFAYLTGSVIYARRNELGVRAPRSPEALAERAHGERLKVRQGMLNRAYGFATRGNRAGALREIDAYIAAEEDSLEARLWILGETARWQDGYVALQLGRRVADYCGQRGLTADLARVRAICEHLDARCGQGRIDGPGTDNPAKQRR